jgi:hypothetical protein
MTGQVNEQIKPTGFTDIKSLAERGIRRDVTTAESSGVSSQTCPASSAESNWDSSCRLKSRPNHPSWDRNLLTPLLLWDLKRGDLQPSRPEEQLSPRPARLREVSRSRT